jgi:hypothetical protein
VSATMFDFLEEWCVGHEGIHALFASEAFASSVDKRDRGSYKFNASSGRLIKL